MQFADFVTVFVFFFLHSLFSRRFTDETIEKLAVWTHFDIFFHSRQSDYIIRCVSRVGRQAGGQPDRLNLFRAIVWRHECVNV